MSKHLFRDLERIKKEILTVGARVENVLNLAITSLTERSAEAAERAIALDQEVDAMEVLVEEECLKVLALHQPVAADLRYIVMVIKVNSDLERMGDHAVHIAERSLCLAREKAIPTFPEMGRMVQKVREMVRDSLDCLVNSDVALARRVCAEDDEVDAMLRRMFDQLQGLMKTRPEAVEAAVHTLSVCRNLERIADLATNVAEDVLFMAEGEIVRHQFGEA